MLWANGKNNSGPASFVLKSLLPFLQLLVGSNYRKTAAKTWNWYQRWLWRNGTQIQLRLKHYYGKFTGWKNAKNRVSFTVSNRIFQSICCKFWTTHISEVAVDTDMAWRKMGTQCTDSGQFLRWKVFNCLNKFIVLDLNCRANRFQYRINMVNQGIKF